MDKLLDLVWAELGRIVDPCSAATARPLSIVEMGLVKDVAVGDGEVTVRLRLTSPSCGMGWYFMQQSDQRLADLPGVDRVTVALDNGLEWTPDMMAKHVREARAALLDRARVVSGRTE